MYLTPLLPLLLRENYMRGWSRLVGALLLLVSSGCTPWPTEEEIADSLEHSLRSVSGGWRGQSFGENPVALDFRLREDGAGKVTGTGNMKESRKECVWPITLSGTYRRPVLALTFVGRRCEGEQVQGALEGDYTTVGGIYTTLKLTTPRSSDEVTVLLQED